MIVLRPIGADADVGRLVKVNGMLGNAIQTQAKLIRELMEERDAVRVAKYKAADVIIAVERTQGLSLTFAERAERVAKELGL